LKGYGRKRPCIGPYVEYACTAIILRNKMSGQLDIVLINVVILTVNI